VIGMTTLREDTKEVAIAIGYDFLIVAFLFSWVIAIVLALVEVSLWVVFGIFLLGCLFFYTAIVISKRQADSEPEQEGAVATTALETTSHPKEEA